jgi:hypothetical protein
VPDDPIRWNTRACAGVKSSNPSAARPWNTRLSIARYGMNSSNPVLSASVMLDDARQK